MKLLSYTHEGRDGWGRLEGDTVVALRSDALPTLRAALQAGLDPKHLQQLDGPRLACSSLTWCQPVGEPARIFAVGVNYPSHAMETGQAAPPAHPSLFARFPSSLVAHEAAMVCPRNSSEYDFEGELAVIIGRPGRHVAEAHALDLVAGYSCFAENSVRDFQRHAAQVTAGKNFDRSGAFGPWLVTADEVGDIQQCELQTRLNGQTVQRALLGQMIFSVPKLIAYISSFTELQPGDVIATGTPDGVGALRKPPLFMKAGDVLEVEISRIGTLRNPVVAEETR